MLKRIVFGYSPYFDITHWVETMTLDIVSSKGDKYVLLYEYVSVAFTWRIIVA